MALTMKEAFETFDMSESRDEETLTRAWFIQGDELNVFDGNARALSCSLLPSITSQYKPTGGAHYLSIVGWKVARKGPTLCLVTYEYKWSRGKGDLNKPPEAEEDRRKLYGVPFNERLEIVPEEERLYHALDANGKETTASIGFSGEGAVIYVPTLTWRFTVNVRPTADHWLTIGKFNTYRYPPDYNPEINRRPFYFEPGTLMYMGSSGGIADRDSVYGPLGMPFSWVWALDFEYRFKPSGWEFFKSSGLQTVNLGPSQNRYYTNPLTKVVKTLTGDVHGRVVVMKLNPSPPPTYVNQIESDRVAIGADFASLFKFNWES